MQKHNWSAHIGKIGHIREKNEKHRYNVMQHHFNVIVFGLRNQLRNEAFEVVAKLYEVVSVEVG